MPVKRGLTPTRYGVLLTVALVSGALTWGVLRVVDRQNPFVPNLPWTAPLALLLLALGVGISALGLRRRLRGDPGLRPVDPIVAARMAVLSKASSHAGAVLAGLYAGVALFILPEVEGDLRRDRLLVALLNVLGAVAVVAAGLFLEHVCRVEPPKDEQPLLGEP
jgi:hypothetical protein